LLSGLGGGVSDLRLAVGRNLHCRFIDFAIARIENRPAPILVFALRLHAADDLQSEPGMIVPVVLALDAGFVGILARLQEHLGDDSVVYAAMISDQEPACRLLGIVIDRLPEANGRRLRA
jgi:hypothetical protein